MAVIIIFINIQKALFPQTFYVHKDQKNQSYLRTAFF